jgi:hypothetical protein
MKITLGSPLETPIEGSRRATVERMPSPSLRRRLSTRVLLICGALAAVHLLLHFATVPALTALAPVSPPIYGLIAGVHSLMPFLARRLTGVPGTAVLTSAIAGLFIVVTNGVGLIAAVPVVLAGAVIDLVVWRSSGFGRRSQIRYLLAAVVAGILLFAVSLAVFSPEHLTPVLLLATLGTRVLGEVIAAVLSGLLASALMRAGVGRGIRSGDQSKPVS